MNSMDLVVVFSVLNIFILIAVIFYIFVNVLEKDSDSTVRQLQREIRDLEREKFSNKASREELWNELQRYKETCKMLLKMQAEYLYRIDKLREHIKELEEVEDE